MVGKMPRNRKVSPGAGAGHCLMGSDKPRRGEAGTGPPGGTDAPGPNTVHKEETLMRCW